MIEVHDVIVQRVGDQNQIADVLRVERNFQVQRVFDGTHTGHGVNRGADATEALREEPGFARIASLQNPLDATPHGRRSPGLGDGSVIHLNVDAEVAFDAGDRVNCDAFRHNVSANL